ncbi:MAG: hypothetical protein IT371_08170 [Deltaproteobacteria bacterium]|nr:hypothetical protein [Deltaproteobacteria bacterium]
MSDLPRLTPLSEELLALLRAERRAPDPPFAVTEELLARVRGTLGLPVEPLPPRSLDAPPTAPSSSAGSAHGTSAGLTGAARSVAPRGAAGALLAALGKPATLLALGVGTFLGGGGVWWAQRADAPSQRQGLRDPGTSPATSVEARASATLPRAATAESRSPTAGAAHVEAKPNPPVRPSARETAPVGRWPRTRRGSAGSGPPAGPIDADTLAAERALLDGVRHALGKGALEEALAGLAEHGERFPRGVLVEEREALAILAQLRSGALSLARRRAARFHARYPQSMLWPALEEALRKRPGR